MKFRLTYYGPLRPTNRDPLPEKQDPLSVHKQTIRQEFHKQLKQLWATNKFLREHKVPYNFGKNFPSIANSGGLWGDDPNTLIPMRDIIANWYKSHSFSFIPLVVEDFGLLCSLDILFLRRDTPGSALSAGDIDNRVKTIIDALRFPKQPNEFVGANNQQIIPGDGETPFYVLLEDDKQVSHFSVETDTLLDPPTENDADHQLAKVIITVELRPYDVTLFNLSYS